MKRALRVSVVVVILIFVAGFAARRYLTSRQVADKVTAQLESVYGGVVKVAAVDIGLRSSSLSRFELFEKEGSTATFPWLTVASLDTDISLFDLVNGEAVPGKITLTGAMIVLRFDKDGKLLTSLPDHVFEGNTTSKSGVTGPLPQIELKQSQVTFKKEGTPDLSLQNIHGTLGKDNDHWNLSLAGENPQWGRWTLSSQLTQGSPLVRVDIKSEGMVHVDQAMLLQVPFVPAAVWREVQISQATTDARVSLTYDPGKKALHYQVKLNPEATDLNVSAVALSATNARGHIVIDDNNHVQLQDVRGTVFHGTLRTDADLDFGSATRLRFPRIDAEKLDVSRLPPSWDFPRQITGRLTGGASLTVVYTAGNAVSPSGIADMVGSLGLHSGAIPAHLAALRLAGPSQSKMHTEGTGKGKITDAKVAGQPTAAPITLELCAVPGGFRFGSNDREGRKGVQPSTITPPGPPFVRGGDDASGAAFLRRGEARVIAALVLPFLQAAQGNAKEVPKKQGPSYLNINLKMKDVDLGKFEQDMNVKLPFPLSGKLSFDVKVAIPLDEARDLKKYKIQGSTQLSELVVGDLKLVAVEAEIALTDGILRLSKLKARLPADAAPMTAVGTISGIGSFQVEPLGDLKVNVILDGIPLSQVACLGGTPDAIQGDLSGTMTAVVPGKTLTDLTTWQARAKLVSKHATAFGWNLLGASAQLGLEKGELTMTDLHGTLEGAPVDGSATLQVVAPFPFSASVQIQNADLAALERLDPRWRPPIAVTGDVQTAILLKGTFTPLAVQVSGKSHADNLKIEGVTVRTLDIGWLINADRITLNDVCAELYDGTITGSAVVPLKPVAAGAIDVQIKNVDAGALVKAVPAIPVRLQGKVNGRVKGTLPAVAAGQERQVQVKLDVTAPKLRVQNIPMEQLIGTIDYQNAVVYYRLKGKTLGGSFALDGQLPSVAGATAKKTKQGRLLIDNVRIHRLLPAFGLAASAEEFYGRLRLELDFAHDPETGWPEGTGRLQLIDVRYKDTQLARAIIGDLVLEGQQLRLRNLSSEFGAGTVRAEMAVNVKHLDRGWFTINLDGVEATHLLGPWLGDNIKGSLQARIRGKLGAELSGTADIELAHGQVMGLVLTQWHLPLTFRIAPSEGRGEIHIHETSALTGHGRLTGKMNLNWGYTAFVDGRLDLSRVDLQTFLRQTVNSAQLGGGLMTARFDFVGRDMRSLDDLTGRLEGSFEQAQAFAVPVLKGISPLLGIGPNTTFQKGTLRARLERGVLHIQGLALEAVYYQVFIEGSVSLHGRLDVDITAGTGNFGIGTPRLRLLGLRIPIAGPVPLVVAQEAASLLGNRLIHVHVGGTLRNPSYRVFPLAAFTQEAVRFFITRTVNPLAAGP